MRVDNKSQGVNRQQFILAVVEVTIPSKWVRRMPSDTPGVWL